MRGFLKADVQCVRCKRPGEFFFMRPPFAPGGWFHVGVDRINPQTFGGLREESIVCPDCLPAFIHDELHGVDEARFHIERAAP